MRTVARMPIIILAIFILMTSFCFANLPYDEKSEWDMYTLNTRLSEIYHTAVYGDHHGPFTEWDKGWDKKDGVPGEYKYLGYNVHNDEITNDRYFADTSSFGKVFDKDYTGVEWLDILPDAPDSWVEIKKDPALLNYMLTANFYDDDHVTAGITDTGFNLKKLFNVPEGSTNYTNIFKKAKVLTTPTQGSSATIYLEYMRTTTHKDWNTVRIPTLPKVECIMDAEITAESDGVMDHKVLAGETENVTIKIDTNKSSWVMADKKHDNFSSRHYWAGVGSIVDSQKVSDSNGIHYITVKNVAPNTTITVWSSVTSDEVSSLGFEGTAEAVATIFIGELVPGVNDFMSISAGAVLKADDRGNERFDVAQGIPSGETIYANVSANEYIGRVAYSQVTGNVDYSVTVNYSEITKDKKTGETVTTPKSSNFSYTRSYSYWQILSLDIYTIDSATINNGALPGGKIVITPSSSYHEPVIDYIDTSNHVSTGATSITVTSTSSEPDKIEATALNAVPNPTVRNDRLIINGKTIMSDTLSATNSSNPIPSNINSPLVSQEALYIRNIKIPEGTRNGLYNSTGNITYSRYYSINPTGQATMTYPIQPINYVSVHTPVYTEFSVSSDDIHNQKPEPAEGLSALVLGRSFSVDITNTGTHRNIPGYGTRDYTAYIKDREIRFGFDTYFGADMTGKYLKANTWYSLEGLGVNKSARQITFYTPRWVDEGTYEAEVRTLAANYTSGASAQQNANTDPYRYAAYDACQVEVSGRVYDFAVTDIDDPAWETFFRVTAGKPDPTGNIFYVGPNNINGDANPSTKYLLPVMPGKNDKQGYGDRAVKLGYAYKFDIKTMGNYYDEHDYLQILPAFYYVDSSGKNRQEVDLYYSTTSKPLIRVGSTDDTLTQSMKLNFTYRGINPSEFINTAEAMFNLRGGIKTYTLDKFKEAFPKVSQNGIIISKYYKVLLSEPVRSFVGPTNNLHAGISRDKALASVQKWYGQYFLPADCLAVPKGTDLTKEKDITKSSPVFLKNGYIIINFKNIAVINDDNFDHPSLKYAGKTGDGWSLEGFNINQKGWELAPGDVFVYYTDKRSTDDYYGAGTH